MRNPIVLLLTFVAALSFAGCQAAFPPNAATVEGLLIEDLYRLVFVLAAIVFLLVQGLVIWSVIRYRRKSSDVVLPAQTHGNLALEIIWTVIPLITVVGLFFASSQVLGVVSNARRGLSDSRHEPTPRFISVVWRERTVETSRGTDAGTRGHIFCGNVAARALVSRRPGRLSGRTSSARPRCFRRVAHVQHATGGAKTIPAI